MSSRGPHTIREDIFPFKTAVPASKRKQSWQVCLSMKRRRSGSKPREWIAGRRSRESFRLTPTSHLLRFNTRLCLKLLNYFRLLRCCKAFSAELLNCLQRTLVLATAHRDQEETFGFPCSLTGISTLPFLAALITTSTCRYVRKHVMGDP